MEAHKIPIADDMHFFWGGARPFYELVCPSGTMSLCLFYAYDYNMFKAFSVSNSLSHWCNLNYIWFFTFDNKALYIFFFIK